MQTTHKRLLLCVVLVSTGAPALVGYALSRRDHRPLDAGRSVPSIVAATAKAERAQHRYRRGSWQAVRPDLFFSARSVPPPQAPLPLPTAPAPPPIAASKDAVDPLADYIYSGTVTVDGEMSALIENRKDHRGWYVKEGETWPSSRVVSLNPREITFEIDGQRHTLTKSDSTDVVPLVTNAGQDSTATPLTENSAELRLSTGLNHLIYLTDSVITLGNGLSQAEIAHIKDDAFEGRISAEEAQRRLQPAISANTVTLDLSYTFGASDSAVILDGIKQP